MLEKISYINMLKDFYGPLLTDKQQEVLSYIMSRTGLLRKLPNI
jgi:predicted DNA-binding protein YlxM (UPF0122 family)